MSTFWRPLAIGLAVALAVACAALSMLAEDWLQTRDERLQATQRADDATRAGQSCSAGVTRLEALTRERANEAREALKEARRLATNHQGRAQQILASPPAVPGDACASAQAAFDDWMIGRQPK